MVYYTAPENSKFALLKAIVDNNSAKAIYGLIRIKYFEMNRDSELI